MTQSYFIAKHQPLILFMIMVRATYLEGFIPTSFRQYSSFSNAARELISATSYYSNRASFSKLPLITPVTTDTGECKWTDNDLYLSKSISQTGPPNMDYHLESIDLSFPGIRVINSNPPVFEIDNFITAEQCANLILMSENSDSLGGMGKSQTFVGSGATSTRTSSTCYLPSDRVPDLLRLVNLLTGVPVSYYEETQICKYSAGQQYSWHYDSIPMIFRKGWGNRLATLIVYLNDVPVAAGGSTAFRDLNLQVQPEAGKALLFFPSYRDGTQDDRVLHSGAMTTDLKWIANIWIHESSYDSPV